MGMGPMTGRAAGYCAGFGMPGFANAPRGWGYGMGYGRGRGFGRGRGLGWGYPGVWNAGPAMAPEAGPRVNPWGAREISREEELSYLQGQAAALKEELDAITGRLKELENEAGSVGKE
jgi:hypothetical protein